MSLKGTNTATNLLRGSINSLKTLTLSAYAIAVKNGYEGTEEEWLRSLSGGETDDTLSIMGVAADAKATGKAIFNTKTELSESIQQTHDLAAGADNQAQITDWYLRTISVTPQMFGAVGDGVHDDTMAVLQAIQCSGTVYFPEGTYLITETLGVGDSVRLIGAGVGNGMVLKNGSVASLDGTCIKYTGDGFLFEIRTEYTNPAVIENMSFTGTSSNSFIKCDSGSWGACVIVRDFYVYNFGSEWLRLVSAFKVLFENGSIRSRGKCLMTTFDETATTVNFNNCISFHNVYISSRWSQDPRIPVMFELYHVKQLQFTECALEQCDVMFKDFVPGSQDWNPNKSCVEDLNLDRCWFEYVGAMYDFRYSEKPNFTNPLLTAINKFDLNLAAGEVDKLNGVGHGYYRNGEKSSIESAIKGTEVVYSSALITNTADKNGENFHPYKITSNHAEFNVPLNVHTEMSTDKKTVSLDLRELVRYSFASVQFKIKIFVMYSVNEVNIWDLEYFVHNKRYYQLNCKKVFSKGTGAAVTATETITDSLDNGGYPKFTTDKETLRLGMIVEYNLNGLTPLQYTTE